MNFMQHKLVAAGAASLLISGGLLATRAYADAPPAPAGAPSTKLVLILTQASSTQHPSDTATRSATLECPGGGTHPAPGPACAELDSSNGDLEKMKTTEDDEECPNFVLPVTASATGTYHGRPVRYSHTFTNSCEMERATHPVFDF